MGPDFRKAHAAGFECLAAWSDLLDAINVFPVADGDTGRNLIVSLAPLRSLDEDTEKTVHELMLQARGNSGNIAARFFAGFLKADSGQGLLPAVREGSRLAREAVCQPLPGTMLTVFETLAEHLTDYRFDYREDYAAGLLSRLELAVRKTPDFLPRLKSAGVVDSGALGMFIFFSCFFSSLSGRKATATQLTDTFKGQLQVRPAFREGQADGHCVDTVIRLEIRDPERIAAVSESVESVVMIPHGDYLKVHFHTDDARAAQERIQTLGRIVHWSDDDIAAQAADFREARIDSPIHIMSDAAGSLTREDARRLGFTLLDAYITAGRESLPETRFSAVRLYEAMRRGLKISTSQASVFERHQHYERLIGQYPHVLYLCVGSAFTGNYSVAAEWQRKNDPGKRFTIIDTGAASGRLGVIVLAAARFAAKNGNWRTVVRYAENAVKRAEEYVFLDRLKYLAAGGRLSRSGAFLGDLLHAKPVISPLAQGAKKVGMAKNRNEQLAFALEKIQERFTRASKPFIMLEYSDNFDWVTETALEKVAAFCPLAEIRLQPLSLTSGVHMGPGTWGVAYLPESIEA